MATVRIKKRPPRESVTRHGQWGCPLTKNRSPWCHRLCHPKNGIGVCGRIAPHALRGRTDLAIQAYKERLKAAS